MLLYGGGAGVALGGDCLLQRLDKGEFGEKNKDLCPAGGVIMGKGSIFRRPGPMAGRALGALRPPQPLP